MPAPQYELLVVRGPSTGTRFTLANKNMTIGRDAVSDIQIGDPEVSRQHALIVPVRAGIQIQDLGSTNGTFVASERVGSNLVFVDPGQTIMLGSAVVLLLQVSENAEIQSEGDPIEEMEQKVRPSSDTRGEGERLQTRSDSLESMPPPKREVAEPDRVTDLEAAPVPATTLSPKPVAAEQAEIGMSPNLILGTVLLLLCCAFSLLLFLLFLGGDWLFRLAGLVP